MTVNLTAEASSVRGHSAGRDNSAALARPFYFMVPLWGEKYRRYFLTRLLPSLLAPNNLPLLSVADGHRFLIATTPEDWTAIADLPIMRQLRNFVTPMLIEISRPAGATAPGSTSAIRHQDVALRLLADAAFRSNAYGSLHWPDCIVSDGLVASLLRHARAGHQLVLCPALRQAEEPALAELKSLGYLPADDEALDAIQPISIPQRVLADLMVRHLHPEMAIYEEGAPGQPLLAPFRYWRLPDRRGIFLHTFHGSPVLLDYGVIERHDLECTLDHSFEDVYVPCNFGGGGASLNVVADSDEFCIMSLTPDVGAPALDRNDATGHVDSGLIRRFMATSAIAYHAAQMPLKSALFRCSVRWHGGDLDAAALAQERRISDFVDRAVASSRYLALPATLWSKYRDVPVIQRAIPRARRLVGAFLGERQARAYVRQRTIFEIKRPFKRTAYWLASGRDLDRYDPHHLSFRSAAGRQVVSDSLFTAGPNTAVILGVGQSNIANEGDPSALFAPTGGVYNFNFFDGRCYVAKDPLLGASIDRSNLLTQVGHLLIERGKYQRVLLAPVAHGGTYVKEWSPAGRMFPRLQWTLDQLKERRIGITHIVWQQGESEAAERNPDPDQWMFHFRAMVAAIRTAGTSAPIYVAQCTICRNLPNEMIRAAQRQVVDRDAGILPGPDTDLVGLDERYDGCHMSAAGLRHAAELWCEVLCRTN